MTDGNAEQSMLAEHARGDSLRTIGKRHNVSHETARRVILQQGSALVDDLSRTLILAEAAQHQGAEALWPAIVIPFGQPQNDWQDAHIMFDWAVKKLRQRGFDISIVSRSTKAGIVLMLTVPGRKQ